jgi:hypothetical protein
VHRRRSVRLHQKSNDGQAEDPARVTRWVIIDAPLPGICPWDDIIRSPALWHLNFRGPDIERLVKWI